MTDPKPERSETLMRSLMDQASDATYIVDAETGDLVQVETALISPGMSVRLDRKTLFEDYREVEGIRIPFRIISTDAATGRIIMQVEEFAAGAIGEDVGNYRAEFVELVRYAKQLQR